MSVQPAASKGGRILVIDDEPMVRDTLAQVLADEGYVVDVAVDGNDALAHVRAARPDAILLDLMMPGMNGRQFLQLLREDPAYASVPVLIMTAVHAVEKPFKNVDELLNKVALAVYRSRDADRLANAPFAAMPSEPAPAKPDRGVVLVVEHDRMRLQRLDVMLSERGYTVVSMTRALATLARLARALKPRAILLELVSDGVGDVVRELRAEKELDATAILVFARDELTTEPPCPEVLARATDADLVGFVERQG